MGRNRHIKHHEFVSADGKDVSVDIYGEYVARDLHDWSVSILDGDDEDYFEMEEADGSEVFDQLKEHVAMLPNAEHFQRIVIESVMGDGDITMDEALQEQAQWEAARATAVSD